jgi:hypothetical protein
MATQEEMSRYFWSASTNCPPVTRGRKFFVSEQKYDTSFETMDTIKEPKNPETKNSSLETMDSRA